MTEVTLAGAAAQRRWQPGVLRLLMQCACEAVTFGSCFRLTVYKLSHYADGDRVTVGLGRGRSGRPYPSILESGPQNRTL